MLQNTFLHVPGIARTTEKRLWKDGCHCWDDLLANPNRWSLGSANRTSARKHIERSKQALLDREHQFFRAGLGMRQAWRAFPDFKDSCVYLDIETDGSAGNAVTMIGMYDGKSYRCLIQNDDLENFRDLISHYSLVITFFGFSYDVPVLQKRFPGLDFDQIHIDLCPMLNGLGYRGGLKKIEKELGIQRSNETEGLTGRDAIWLWRKFRTHDDEDALKRLIAYNREDCVNLETLALHAYDCLKANALEEAGFESGTGMKSPIGISPIMPISHVPQLPGLEEFVQV